MVYSLSHHMVMKRLEQLVLGINKNTEQKHPLHIKYLHAGT